MLENPTYSKQMDRIYIHQIQPLHCTYVKNKEITLNRYHKKICYFGTYIEAAIDAYKHKLIRITGLKRIMEDAVKDFQSIPLSAWAIINAPVTEDKDKTGNDSTGSSTNTKELLLAQSTTKRTIISSSLNKKTKITPSFASISKTKPLSIKHHYHQYSTSASSNTQTLLTKTNISATSSRSGASATNTSASRQQQQLSSLHHSEYVAEIKRELRIRELNNDLEKGNALLKSIIPLTEAVPLLRYSNRYQIGSIIYTLYGPGVLTHFRDEDGIYEIDVFWTHGNHKTIIKVYIPGISIN